MHALRKQIRKNGRTCRRFRQKGLGRHFCRTKLPPKTFWLDTKHGLKIAKNVQGLPKGWFAKRPVLADLPPEREGTFRMFPRNENRNEGTFACSPGTRAHSPKPPFYETALLSPSEMFKDPKKKKFKDPKNDPKHLRKLSAPLF